MCQRNVPIYLHLFVIIHIQLFHDIMTNDTIKLHLSAFDSAYTITATIITSGERADIKSVKISVHTYNLQVNTMSSL